MLNYDARELLKLNDDQPSFASESLPFTYRGYLMLLRRLAAAGYSFSSFTEAPLLYQTERRFVLIRHDVDLDLEKALTMARLENKFGVKATYFFLLRSEHYNLLTADSSRIVSEILSLGHWLGLHFDCAAYSTECGISDWGKACRREVELLQGWFDQFVTAVSFHRPGALVLAGDAALSAPLPHTYQPFFTKQIRYCSDSRGQWRDGDPTQLEEFRRGFPLHILAHPIWWNDEPTKPRECLNRFVAHRMESLQRSVAANCTVYRHLKDDEASQ